MTDHDRLFKELLSTFFLEFLDLFAPDLAREVEPGSLALLDKELFTDVTAGEHHVVDLLARIRLRGEPSAVLVHVETQAQPVSEFARRMYRYFAGLELRHALPVYPIAVLSYDRPRSRQPDRLDLLLPGLHVLRFRFRSVQLNRLNWRDYLRRPSPVAAALMARMRIAPKERVRAKLECLRLLATLRLDPARTRLVSGFVDNYLRLTGEERTLFDREVRRVPEQERGKVMEITTSWMEEGIEKGRYQATLHVVLRQLSRRVAILPETTAMRVGQLSLPDLEALAEALLDFRSPDDLDRWLARHGKQ